MLVRSTTELTAADSTSPVEIADGVWWVGTACPGEDMCTNTYLIDNGDRSVLIDPGPRATFETMLGKVREVIDPAQLQYIICQHQDPDITGSLPQLEQHIQRSDAVIVSHWRASTLIKHFDLRLPFWLVEQHDWQLDLGARSLRFVFTPYLHFPGAFCTFDARTGVLFSSDLFSGLGANTPFVARDGSYFEALRDFHQQYMPGPEILNSGLDRLAPLPIRLIAPQHGALIPRGLIGEFFRRLRTLECGVGLLEGADAEAVALLRSNRLLRQLLGTMVLHRTLKGVAGALVTFLADAIPQARSLEFYAAWNGDETLCFAPRSRYRGVPIPSPSFASDLLAGEPQAEGPGQRAFAVQRIPREAASADSGSDPSIVLRLDQGEDQDAAALAVIRLICPIEVPASLADVLAQMRVPLAVAIQRERIYRQLEAERQRIYEQSIRDPLTGLYTRRHMDDVVGRQMAVHDRDPSAPLALVLFDVDHFKQVNDAFGHPAGDAALKLVAEVVRAQVRAIDLPVRMGGEEIAVFLPGKSARHGAVMADRVRREIAAARMPAPHEAIRLTVSAGVAMRRVGDSLEALVAAADAALYTAKRSGRNQVCEADRSHGG